MGSTIAQLSQHADQKRREHKRRNRRERNRRYKQRKKACKACVSVEVDEEMIGKLVYSQWLRDGEDDPAIIAAAIRAAILSIELK
jgi:hypothetical protein